MKIAWAALAALTVLGAACAGPDTSDPDPSPPETSATAQPGGDGDARPWHRAAVHEGGGIVRGARAEALYVADEDRRVLHVVPLPLGAAAATEIASPGRTAQDLALHDRVLVTSRDPGMLIALVGEGGERVVRQRIALPGDAWGI